MKRLSRASLLLAIAAVGACESTTAPVVEVVDEASLAQFAEVVSESDQIRLPSLGALLRASRQAIQARDGNAEAVGHFRRARRLASAAEDALEGGKEDEAKRLSNRSRGHTLQGIVAALGIDAVAEAVAGSTAGLERIEQHLEGRDVPARITKHVDRIRRLTTAAAESLEAGSYARALGQALASAEAIRHLSPRYVARKRIGQATRLLRSAIASVGDSPTTEEATALRRAHRLLRAAKDELEAGRARRAVAAATRAARLSAGVLTGRASG